MEDKYVPSLEAMDFLDRVERLEAAFRPLPANFYKNISEKKKPKKKHKQMKITTAFKNIAKGPMNFQGEPVDKCEIAPELGDKPVFVHANYLKAWKKRQKEAVFDKIPADDLFCGDCHLRPCSARMLQTKLQCDACTLTQLAEMTEDEHVFKLRLYYRAQMVKLQGKRFINRIMPTNEKVPDCVKRMTSEIARVHACDESSEDGDGAQAVCRNGSVNLDAYSSEEETWDEPSNCL
jgi:hypothetical protein